MKNLAKETLYKLSSDCLEVGISNVGASIRYVRFKTPKGYRELCLGYRSLKERIDSGTYCGAVIGRVSNRIAGAQYQLNGKTYHLTPNDGNNTLHGGAEGFDRRSFEVEQTGNCLKMTLVSPDGDQGFGGKLTLTVTFSVENNQLNVQFCAMSDSDTVWAPTIHPYFNFGAEGSVLDTVLQIYANQYTPMNDQHIPTGEIAPVEATVFDFRTPKPIGKDFDLTAGPLVSTHGFDHNFVLCGEHAATAFGRESGVQMDLYTNLPGLQLYTGNYLNGHNGKRRYQPFDGFTLEPQFFPNSVNQQGFETPVLKAGEEKTYFIRYIFEEIRG